MRAKIDAAQAQVVEAQAELTAVVEKVEAKKRANWTTEPSLKSCATNPGTV